MRVRMRASGITTAVVLALFGIAVVSGVPSAAAGHARGYTFAVHSEPAFYSVDADVCPTSSTCLGFGAAHTAGQKLRSVVIRRGKVVSSRAFNDEVTWRGADCLSAARCVFVGDDGGWVQSVVWSKGKLSKPHHFMRYSEMYDVACPTTSGCLAVGRGDDVEDYGYFRTLTTDGHASGKPIVVPHINDLESLSCWTATKCAAVGVHGRNLYGTGYIVWYDGGKITGKTKIAHKSELTAVSCTSHGHCLVVGRRDSGRGIVASVRQGEAASVTTVKPFLFGLACFTESRCIASGMSSPSGTGTSALLPVSRSAVPGAVRAVPGTTGVGAPACVSAHRCYAGGDTQRPGEGSNGHGSIVTITRHTG